MNDHSVLHLIPYSSFLPFVVSVFEEAAPRQNHFLVYGLGELPSLPGHALVEGIGTDERDLERVRRATVGKQAIIAHSMSSFAAQAISASPVSALRVWSGWGGEYSGSRTNPMANLLGSTTARRERRGYKFQDRVLETLNNRYLDSLYREAARSVDIFSAPVPTDFGVFRRRFRSFHGRYMQLNYASVEDTYATMPDRSHGVDVLVGNSATPENNHFETFRTLAKCDLDGRRVVVPLAYGDSSYADDVVRAGTELFGDRLVALREHKPLHEYNAIMASCGVVVMGHRRQQALGNVARAIWQGSHVYLDRRSPIFEYFQQVGLPAHRLDRLHGAPLPATENSDQSIGASREIMKMLWSRDVVVNNIRQLLDEAALRAKR